MIQEKKTFNIIHSIYNINNIIYHRQSFGWLPIGFNSTYVYMVRNINVKNLTILKSYEEKYNSSLKLYQYYHNASKIYLNLFILGLFMVLIIPGLIYFGYKLMMKYKANCQLNINEEIVKKARRLNM